MEVQYSQRRASTPNLSGGGGAEDLSPTRDVRARAKTTTSSRFRAKQNALRPVE